MHLDTVNPDRTAQGHGLTFYQWGIVSLCVFVSMAEGYDIQAMALAAPLIAKAWNLPTETIGILLSSAVLGIVAGSVVLSPIGDSWGRRKSALLALSIALAGTYLSAWVTTVPGLLAARFVAGVGLGLALPIITAIASEIVAPPARSMTVILVSCGYPLGAGIGGGIAGSLIDNSSYRAAFELGAAATLAALMLCAIFLPETHPARKAGTSLEKTNVPAERFFGKVASLLAAERRLGTLLLWVINFANMMLIYYCVTWMPTLFVGQGLGARAAIFGASIFSGGGVIGSLLMIALLRRWRAAGVLLVSYTLSLGCIAGLIVMPAAGWPFFAILAIAGGAMLGSQYAMNAVVAGYYPSNFRATGCGFTGGIGRVGAVLAPVLGGIAIGKIGTSSLALGLAAVPALIAILATWLLMLSHALDRQWDETAT